MNVDEITNEINKLSYEDRFKLYVRCFGFGNLLSDEFDDKLILISLIALTANKLKEKNPKLTTLDVLLQITKEKEGTSFYNALENLSMLVDDLSYGVSKFNSYGLTDSKQIINKIKELLNTWTPF
jgi:hypothetical protein